MHGNIAPNLKTNECDVLIAIGMRFDDRVTGDLSTYAKQAKVIHFDIDAAEIGKNIPADVPILGNVKTTLPLVTKLLNKNTHTEWIASFEEAEQKEKELVIDYEIHPKNGAIKMGETIAKISEATRHEAVVVTDVGQNQMMAARYSKFTQPKSFITSGGLGTMGFGVPAAIGAKIGAPDRTVVLFVGDGGFQMTMQELGTIMQEKIGVKIVILNNNYLGMVRQWQELFHAKRYSSTPMQNPDFVAIAKAYGIKSERVSERSKLDTAIDTMLANDEPYLLVVDVEESGLVYPMIPAGTCVTNIIVNGEKIKL